MKNVLSAILFFVFLLILYTNGQAQDRHFGIKGGASAYDLTTDFGSIETTSGRKIGFEAGIFGDFPINKLLSIQAEVLFVQKGGEDSEGTSGVSSATLNYIDVPMLLKINAPLRGRFKPYIFGGGYAGYLIEATSGLEEPSQDITQYMENINYGAKFGLGANIGSIVIDLRYDMGLANLLQDTDPDQAEDFKMTTSGVIGTLGITF